MPLQSEGYNAFTDMNIIMNRYNKHILMLSFIKWYQVK